MSCLISALSCCFKFCCPSAKVAPQPFVPAFPVPSSSAHRSLTSLVVSSPSGNDIQLAGPAREERRDDPPFLRALKGLSDNNFATLDLLKAADAVQEKRCYVEDLVRFNAEMSRTVDDLLAQTKEARKAAREREAQRDRSGVLDPQGEADKDLLNISFLTHELRTPLSNIAELLARPPLSEDRFFEDLEASFKLIRSHIDDLSASQGAIRAVRPRSADALTCRALEERIRRIVGYYARRHGVELDFAWPQLGCTFRTNKKVLCQILLNLISNGVKFTQENGERVVRIVVRVLEEDDHTFLLEFNIVDKGPGISKEDQKKLFLPFSQAAVATTAQVKSSGLGLAYAKQLAESLNGVHQGPVIGVESDVGLGARFWFKAVVCKVRLLSVEEAQPPTPRPPLTETLYHKDLRILLAEDSPVSQKIGLGLLRKGCCRDCDGADNGRIAVQKFSESKFDVVITDMEMPELYGWEVILAICRIVQEKELLMPHFIVASSYESDETKQILRLRGVTVPVAVIGKPYQYNVMIGTINRITTAIS